jgi:hypothetical protein
MLFAKTNSCGKTKSVLVQFRGKIIQIPRVLGEGGTVFVK